MSAEFHQPIPPAVAEAAAAWLARRDRGLTAVEQDEYLAWLAATPRHGEALGQHAAALERMMRLYEWTPAHDTEPNPELFKPSRSASALRWARLHWALTAAMAGTAAAALTVAALLATRPGEPVASPPADVPKSYLRVNERMALPDGSRVELKDGTLIVVQYSATERRVKLAGGEAHFSVWKDKDRPFVVDAAGVEVRAVGTAFNVRVEPNAVEVLVTQGRVAVAPHLELGAGGGEQGDGIHSSPSLPSPAAEIYVAVGERAVVPLRHVINDAIRPVVAEVSLEDIARELAWQAPRLQFHETPLVEAVAEFNRLNRHQLELGDPALGALRIGGTFRPDNVEGFVRLLGETLDLHAAPGGENRTVLTRGP